MSDRTMKLRSGIERDQRRPKSKPPVGGGTMRFTPTGIEYFDADGNPFQPKPDAQRAEHERMKHQVEMAQAAFEDAVVADWPHAMDRFFEWIDSRIAVNAAFGTTFIEVPDFAEWVSRIAYEEAVRRRREHSA